MSVLRELPRLARATTFVLLTCAACACSSHSATASKSNEAALERAEQRDVDAALVRTPHGSAVVDSYRIEGEILTLLVPAAAWSRLGAATQGSLKHALWQAWSASFTRRHPEDTDRIFLKVDDLQGNDLGSYFE